MKTIIEYINETKSDVSKIKNPDIKKIAKYVIDNTDRKNKFSAYDTGFSVNIYVNDEELPKARQTVYSIMCYIDNGVIKLDMGKHNKYNNIHDVIRISETSIDNSVVNKIIGVIKDALEDGEEFVNSHKDS